MKKYLALAAVVLIAASSPAMARKKSVAVMNFANYAGKGMKYLSSSLPESISASLSDVEGIRVVERRQLGKILNELALEQTGVIDTDQVSRAGKIARADVLILGSVSGNPSSIVVTIKAVEASTGSIISGKVIRSPLSTLFERVNQSSQSMGAVITGKGIGKISVSTTPSGGRVYIDGLLVGTSPIVEYKVTVGKHRVKAVKDGYMDYEDIVFTKKNGHDNIRAFLPENKYMSRAQFGLGTHYFVPFKKEIKAAPYYFLFIGQSFDKIVLTAEAGFSKLYHDQEMTVFGSEVTQERFYNIFTLHGQMKFIPFPTWKYISPYIGIIGGWSYIADKRPNDLEDDGFLAEDVELLDAMHRLAIGGMFGFNIMPLNRVSLFVDGRLYYYPKKLSRDIYGQEFFLGEIKVIDSDRHHLMSFSIGGGVKFYFGY